MSERNEESQEGGRLSAKEDQHIHLWSWGPGVLPLMPGI